MAIRRQPPPVALAADDPRPGILYLAPWVDLGGSDKGTIDWFRHVDRSRWRLSLITTQPEQNRWLDQVEPYADEVWDLPDLLPGFEFPEFILSFIVTRRIRVVHIMNSRLAFDLLPDMAALPDPPVTVVQSHAEEPDRAGYVSYVATRYANLVDAWSLTSEWLADAVAAYDVPRSRLKVIKTGVDAVQEFDPARIAPLPLEGNGHRILWPGRLVEQKDPLLTVEVVRRLVDRDVDFTLHFVGAGHLEGAVRERAAALGVADRLRFHPPSQEMSRWYRASDLLLMTSVFEGIPYVIFEALAMGVPVVAPALPGNREIVDQHAGILIDPRDDADAYADAIAELLRDDARRGTMGEASRERMLREHTLEEMGRAHSELYQRLLDTRPVAARADTESDRPSGDGPAPVRAGSPLRLERDPPPEPTVAVIVPCYRHGRYLPGCLDSILAQDPRPDEVIVVDDASPDDETRAALDAAQALPGVRVLRLESNSGPSVARNTALREVTANYVLPLDADDQLLPGALAAMVERLAAAPPHVGFIYPNPRHFGNRHDYVIAPAYNLHVLMHFNYCAAASLFDRRVFDAGITYGEDIVHGHEDWDLVLALAERGVEGRPADGPTFLYRKRGFSRVNAGEHAAEPFEDVVRRRHRPLYAAQPQIKARWAPVLSLLLLGGVRDERARAGIERQTCGDFEVLSADDGGAAGESPAAWLARAIAAARGRFVAVCDAAGAGALARPEFAEVVIRAIGLDDRVPGLVLAVPQGARGAGFRQLDAAAAEASIPAVVAWARQPEHPLRPHAAPAATLGDEPLHDLVLALQTIGPLQWRVLPERT